MISQVLQLLPGIKMVSLQLLRIPDHWTEERTLFNTLVQDIYSEFSLIDFIAETIALKKERFDYLHFPLGIKADCCLNTLFN